MYIMGKRIYIDMDDVLCDFKSAFETHKKRFPELQYPQSREGFFKGLAPIDGGLTVMEWLYAGPDFDPYILTAPSVYNPLCYTEKRLWVEDHLGFDWCHRLILSPNKSLLIGDYLIDDRDQGHGQDEFKGQLIQFGTEQFPDWASVSKYLRDLT